MINEQDVTAYQKALGKRIAKVEEEPTRRVWEYYRKRREAVDYIDTGAAGDLLSVYATEMGISLSEASQIILWKYDQYQNAMVALETVRLAIASFTDGMDRQAANDLFDRLNDDLLAVEQSLADPGAP